MSGTRLARQLLSILEIAAEMTLLGASKQISRHAITDRFESPWQRGAIRIDDNTGVGPWPFRHTPDRDVRAQWKVQPSGFGRYDQMAFEGGSPD